jgi:AcrR family transcriptional regulator
MVTVVDDSLAALPALPMAQPEPGERSDAARNRRAILAAAERLVAQRGAEAVTMDAVAAAAGVGKGTLFRRFSDRAGLLRALLDERERAFQDAFIRGPAPLGPGAPPRERLVAFGEQLLDLIEIHGDLLAGAEQGGAAKRLRHTVYAAYRAHVAILLGAISPERDIEYLSDALLATLAADLVLYQRRVLGLPQQRLKNGWRALVDDLAAAAFPA